jgi:transaldolase/glucose-6-phosphate isomerase
VTDTTAAAPDTTAGAPAGHGTRITSELQGHIDGALRAAVEQGWAERIWARDTSVWTNDEKVSALIDNRLGWLDLPDLFLDEIEPLEAFAAEIREEGMLRAVVAGMGGSSLAPAVLAAAIGAENQGISVDVLDSTDPDAIAAATDASDPNGTLYIISSKSGTTTEPLAFLAHFWDIEQEAHKHIHNAQPGLHFVAVTDPAPSVTHIPHADEFRETFLNQEDVGGRYSALSYVGLVPGALMGIDLRALLTDAQQTAARTKQNSEINPGLWLGVVLGTLARAGRDKLTLAIEPRFESLGMWIEQLVAESTGKHGVGILPVAGEEIGAPDSYGDDRVFVRVATGNDMAWQQQTDAKLETLAAAGHPVVYLQMLGGEGALGGEFFRWEFATAVAGAVLGINPFDEPNVTESKDNTKRVLEQFRHDHKLPAEEALSSEGALTLSGDAPLRLSGSDGGLVGELRRHLARAKPRGYFALQAYIAPSDERAAALREIATLLRDKSGRAVTVGFGPRFLHSTGQLHKGGAPIGCFVQLTANHPTDVEIPGWHETFGTLIDAQAVGDFISLESHELPVARINLGDDPDAGLEELLTAFQSALTDPLAR